jgi:hypothetical protein
LQFSKIVQPPTLIRKSAFRDRKIALSSAEAYMKFLGKSELRRLCKGGASGRTGWKGKSTYKKCFNFAFWKPHKQRVLNQITTWNVPVLRNLGRKSLHEWCNLHQRRQLSNVCTTHPSLQAELSVRKRRNLVCISVNNQYVCVEQYWIFSLHVAVLYLINRIDWFASILKVTTSLKLIAKLVHYKQTIVSTINNGCIKHLGMLRSDNVLLLFALFLLLYC